MNALMKYKGIEVVCVNELPCESLDSFDMVYCPSTCVDVSLYPGVRFVFGPHFSVFPDASQMDLIRGSFYIQPSSWVLDFWRVDVICRDIQLRVLPFGVDTDLFRPIAEGGVKKENVVVYFKRRKPEELQFVENILRYYRVSYRIFSYGSYSETDYLQYLKGAKYGIWLDAHESQGFALEEALSMNVPLLVWNVRVLSQEYGSSYPEVAATTIPYWDDSCGEVVYDWEDFAKVYSLFLSKLGSYRPRDFVIKDLSIDVCSARFVDLVREVKGEAGGVGIEVKGETDGLGIEVKGEAGGVGIEVKGESV
jgi:glycosyltransferase involved in cell wall biosynthesis